MSRPHRDYELASEMEIRLGKKPLAWTIREPKSAWGCRSEPQTGLGLHC